MAGLKTTDDGLPIKPIIHVIDATYYDDGFTFNRFPRELRTFSGSRRFRSLADYAGSHDPYCRDVVFGAPDDRWLPALHGRSAPSGFQIVEGMFL